MASWTSPIAGSSGVVTQPKSSAEANPVVVVGDSWANASSVGRVVVGAVGKSGIATGIVEGYLLWGPIVAVGVMHKNRTFGTVEVALTVYVGFQFSKVG